MKWRFRIGAALSVVLISTAALLAQGPYSAQIQAAIQALLQSNAVVSGNWTCTGTCTGFGGGGGIGGTIASGQVAFGTGANTIGGSSSLTWNGSVLTVPAIMSPAATTLTITAPDGATGGEGVFITAGSASTSGQGGDIAIFGGTGAMGGRNSNFQVSGVDSLSFGYTGTYGEATGKWYFDSTGALNLVNAVIVGDGMTSGTGLLRSIVADATSNGLELINTGAISGGTASLHIDNVGGFVWTWHSGDFSLTGNQNGHITFPGAIVTHAIDPTVETVTDTTSITPNTDVNGVTYQANTQSAGTLTINADAGTPTDGRRWILKIKSTNVQTFSWNGSYVGGTVALPTATTGSGKIDNYAFLYDGVNSKWQFVGSALGF